jgi:hypothetical protein
MAPNEKKSDPDREAEGLAGRVDPNAPASFAPRRAADDTQVKETAKQASARRVKGARFFAGRWETADGDPLTDQEAQQAHRAMDKAAAEARERALRGEV